MVNQNVYDLLKRIAHDEKTIYYSNLNVQCGLDLDFKKGCDRKEIGAILGEVSLFEYEQGRDLLSIVVVNKTEQINRIFLPSNGFFKLAQRLKVMTEEESKIEFFSRELRNVYNYWKEQTL